MLYYRRLAVAIDMKFMAYNILWPYCLIETSERLKWIHHYIYNQTEIRTARRRDVGALEPTQP